MNFYTKLALGVLGVGAICGAWYADEYYTKKEQEEKTQSSKALSFETDKVRKVTLTNPGGTFVFERKEAGTDWTFAAGTTAPGAAVTKPDQDAVNNLVSALQSINVETTLEGTEKALKEGAEEGAAFGLKEPRGVAEVTLEGGKTQKVRIGSDVSIGSNAGSTFNALSVYAATPSRDRLLVVGSSVVSAMQKGYADFRTKVAGDFKTADVKGVSLVKGDARIELSKGDKDWRVTAPRELAADNNNVGLFLDRYARLRVDKVTEKDAVTEENRGALGLAVPAAVVEMRGADGKVLQKFELGLTNEGVFVTMADGAVGSVDVGQFADLAPELKYFRDRRVMRDVTMADATTITTKSGKTYRKEGSNWYSDAGTAAPAPAPPAAATEAKTASAAATPAASGEKVSDKDAYDVFSQWEFLTADEVVDNPSANLAEYGLATPLTTLSFGFKDGGAKPVEVLVGSRVPKNEKLVYVKRVDKPEVFVVETQWLDALARMDGAAGQSPQAKK